MTLTSDISIQLLFNFRTSPDVTEKEIYINDGYTSDINSDVEKDAKM